MMPNMTPKKFWETAATWGSAMTSGDPGACMYGFSENGVVQSEQHRADCIRWIEDDCRKAAIVNAAAGESLAEQNAELDALLDYLRSAPVAGSMPSLDEFTKAYVAAALFSSTNPDSDTDAALDDDFGPEHIATDTLQQMIADCALFQKYYGHLFENSESDAGHDFWLTRVGHGAGFWDGDWEDEIGKTLTEASKSFGNVDLLVGDDGFIHGMGGDTDPDPVAGVERPTENRPS
jgi:hypothetical protein